MSIPEPPAPGDRTPSDGKAGPPPIPKPAPVRVGNAGVEKLVIAACVVALLVLFVVGGVAAFFLFARHAPAPSAAGLNPPAAPEPAGTKAEGRPLNEDQRLVMQWSEYRFGELSEKRALDGWSAGQRANLEAQSIATLTVREGARARTDDYFKAINTLAALHSTRALPDLRKIALNVPAKPLRAEVSNRGRWMAVRALGVIGDTPSVPQLIHLLYHNNVETRWWAQIALVQLTGQNFGRDWQAWGNWWNSQNGQPPFSTNVVRWSDDQPEPDRLVESLADSDQKFLDEARGRSKTVIDDDFWANLDRRNYDAYRKALARAPRILVVRPSHYDLNQLAARGDGMHWGWVDGRMADLTVTLPELVSYAYTKQAVWDPRLPARTEFPQEWRQGHFTNNFDVIDTLKVQPVERLQTEIKRLLSEQFGFAWHYETRDTSVLLINVKDAPLFESKISRVFTNSESIPEFATGWENYFGLPVVDSTGLTNRYDRKIELIPAAYVPDRTTNLDANNAYLAQYGLELIPTNQPVEWLALERETPAEK